MNKRIYAVVILLALMLSTTACSNKSELTVNTMVGELNASDYYNWEKYESDVVMNTKLSSEEQAEIDSIIKPLEDGTAADSDINSIKDKYGSIEKYREYLEVSAKYNKVKSIAYSDIEITEQDRKAFLNNYNDTFAGMNALVFQFSDIEKANNFIVNNSGKSRDEILKYIASSIDKESIDWKEINDTSDKSGISLLHNADSDKYNYCMGEVLKGVFESLQDGQMSGVFDYGGKSTVLIRVSNGIIEKDDALIDNYMLKMKQQEAYKKYIIEHK